MKLAKKEAKRKRIPEIPVGHARLVTKKHSPQLSTASGTMHTARTHREDKKDRRDGKRGEEKGERGK